MVTMNLCHINTIHFLVLTLENIAFWIGPSSVGSKISHFVSRIDNWLLCTCRTVLLKTLSDRNMP